MSDPNYNQGNQNAQSVGQGNQNAQPIGHDQAEQLKHVAEGKIDVTIDQFAQKIPGGTQFSQQAKDTVAGALDNLEKQAEAQAGNLLGNAGNIIGGLFGHHNEEHK